MKNAFKTQKQTGPKTEGGVKCVSIVLFRCQFLLNALLEE
jgi:hypothetical protein